MNTTHAFAVAACLMATAPISVGQTQGTSAPQGPHSAEKIAAWTEIYSLGSCPVSGKTLGSMGDSIVRKYDGREVRFCCEGCIDQFEADAAGYWKRIDRQIVQDQGRYYPVGVCVVSGEPLVEGGEDIGSDFVYGNRLVRLCCRSCEKQFKSDPRRFIETLDKAAAEAQRTSYPLDTCVVGGGRLGSMGEPVEVVLAGRLVRLCCGRCEAKLDADPTAFITVIDAAWRAKGMFVPKPEFDHGEQGAEEHDGHGAHPHGG